MRNKLSFVVIVSFLNTVLVSGAVAFYDVRINMSTWFFTAGMFMLTFIVFAAIAFKTK
jgi:hypothetical protein